MQAYKRILSAILLVTAFSMQVSWAQENDIYQALAACCGEREDGLVTRLPIHDVPVFEMIVVSDCSSENTALNPNLSWNKVDLDASLRTAYLEAPDGSWGLRLEFRKGAYNRLMLYDRVKLNLNGCKVRMDAATMALQVTGVGPLNILSRTKGDAASCPVKEKYISELTDADIYTLVTLKDVEFVFKEGSIINIDEVFGQEVPSIHSGIRSKMRREADGAVTMLRDACGNGIPMAVNTRCAWRKEAAPRGSGTVTGILVVERNRRYGDAASRLYIRPLFRNQINISDNRRSAAWKNWLGWFPGRMPGNDFDFEKAGFGPKGVDDRLLNNVGPKAYFSTDAGERRIQKAGGFNSLKSEDGIEAGGSIKLYGTISGWYHWGADGEIESGKSVFLECNPSKLKASQMQLCFEMAAGDANLLNDRGIPTRWKVEYSIDEENWKPLKTIDGEETFGLRPIPGASKTEKGTGREYHLMYDACLGMQQHCYNLPDEVIGAKKLLVRISPCVGRWYHLSTNPARDVEYPDAKVNLVKQGNKQFSTVRFGSIFFDYR